MKTKVELNLFLETKQESVRRAVADQDIFSLFLIAQGLTLAAAAKSKVLPDEQTTEEQAKVEGYATQCNELAKQMLKKAIDEDDFPVLEALAQRCRECDEISSESEAECQDSLLALEQVQQVMTDPAYTRTLLWKLQNKENRCLHLMLWYELGIAAKTAVTTPASLWYRLWPEFFVGRVKRASQVLHDQFLLLLVVLAAPMDQNEVYHGTLRHVSPGQAKSAIVTAIRTAISPRLPEAIHALREKYVKLYWLAMRHSLPTVAVLVGYFKGSFIRDNFSSHFLGDPTIEMLRKAGVYKHRVVGEAPFRAVTSSDDESKGDDETDSKSEAEDSSEEEADGAGAGPGGPPPPRFVDDSGMTYASGPDVFVGREGLGAVRGHRGRRQQAEMIQGLTQDMIAAARPVAQGDGGDWRSEDTRTAQEAHEREMKQVQKDIAKATSIYAIGDYVVEYARGPYLTPGFFSCKVDVDVAGGMHNKRLDLALMHTTTSGLSLFMLMCFRNVFYQMAKLQVKEGPVGSRLRLLEAVHGSKPKMPSHEVAEQVLEVSSSVKP